MAERGKNSIYILAMLHSCILKGMALLSYAKLFMLSHALGNLSILSDIYAFVSMHLA
jgi:hypothetical protein